MPTAEERREPHLAAFARHAALDDPSPNPAPLRPIVPRPAFVPDSLRDRVMQWRDDPRAAAAAVAIVALVAGVFFYRSAMAGGAEAERPPDGAQAVLSTSTSVPREIVVHVAGAVVSPGVYRFPDGARVGEAVALAGGAVDGGEPDRLNLAARLADGQRVHVPRAGEPLPADAAGNPSSAPSGGASAGPVNVNVATAQQLEALPGVGPSLAQAIIAERDRRGGFRKVDELLAVRGIGEKRLADLKPLVAV
ncbi:MAG TPA: helix-hairpin-helix domain-containing protein [Acidimicrobiia bacterium]|nr:helix-hairpin-helix domain-containing protein [Acidimicrobiia bacterium]